MKDTLGRNVMVGDTVVYASAYSNAYLCVGIVRGYCKSGADAVRVEVFHSSRAGFKSGTRNWRTGEYTRQPGQSYMATVGAGENLLVINGAEHFLQQNPKT